MSKILVTIALVCIWSSEIISQNWEIFPVARGTKPSIAVDSEGRTHLAYMWESGQGFVDYAVGINGNFTTTRVEVGYHYGPLDITVDQLDIPHIVFHDHNEQDANHAFRSGESFTVERILSGGHDGWDASVVVDANNVVHVVSVDPSTGVEYAYKSNGVWQVESLGSGQVMYANSTSLALDSQGNPHCTYYLDSSADLYYASRSSTGVWNLQVIESEGDVGRFASLVLDENDRPHISYVAIDGTTATVRYAYHNGAQWLIEDVDLLENVRIAFTGARNMTALWKDGQRYILTYGDLECVRMGILENDNWSIQTVVQQSPEDLPLGQQVDMAMDTDGGAHVTYFEVTNTASLDGEVKYAYISELVSTVDTSEMQDTSGIPDTLLLGINCPGAILCQTTGFDILASGFQDIVEASFGITWDPQQARFRNLRSSGDIQAGLVDLQVDSISGELMVTWLSPNQESGTTLENTSTLFSVDMYFPGPGPKDIGIDAQNTIRNADERTVPYRVQSCQTTLSNNYLQLDVEVTHPDCDMGNNGVATAMPRGGTPPYGYIWTTSESGQNIANLTAGSYGVTVTDASGCTVNSEVILSQQGVLDIDLIIQQPVSCPGASDGSISVEFDSGLADPAITWNTGAETSLLDGLAAGDYAVTVISDNCSASESIELEEPSAITLQDTSILHDHQGQSNGSIYILPQGGSGPYQYQWSNGESTQVINNLAAGTYDVTVTDQNGCSAMFSLEVEGMSTTTIELISGTLKIFPNPTSGTLYFESTGSLYGQLELFDSRGRQIRKLTPGQRSYDLSDLTPGLYLLKLTHPEHSRTALIVKR